MDLALSTGKISSTTLTNTNTRTTISSTISDSAMSLASLEGLHLTAARLLLLPTMALILLLLEMDLTLLPAMDQDLLARLVALLEALPLLPSSARKMMKSSPDRTGITTKITSACTPSSTTSNTVDPRLMALPPSFAGSLSVSVSLLLRLTLATTVTPTTMEIRKSASDLEADVLYATLITRKRMDPKTSLSARTTRLVTGLIITALRRRRWRWTRACARCSRETRRGLTVLTADPLSTDHATWT